MPGRLAGKVALISGTAGGQGRRAAVHFAAEGAKVVGCDVKVAEAEETVEMVRAAGGEMVSFQPVDLTEEAAVEGWIESAVQAYGDFDILYNNAAVARAASLEDLERADWDWNMANEVTLVYMAVRHALPVLSGAAAASSSTSVPSPAWSAPACRATRAGTSSIAWPRPR